jgi:hypothetical protein
MKIPPKYISIVFAILIFSTAEAQKLKPGFDKNEFIEVLKTDLLIAYDTAEWKGPFTVSPPQTFKFIYRSPLIGLQNMWDLWINNDSVAIINIRGTDIKPNPVSWLVNYYAAMVPAKGKLELEKNFIFNYNLSEDEKAAVHVGFLVSTAYLSRSILPKIDSCYRKLGIKNFIIAGHSQGGAITYLMTSYLESLKSNHTIPSDIRFKTYSSAAPKVGNLYYAYTYEALTRDWAFNVVNTCDWVPEVPFSIQTVNDFTEVNPFTQVKPMLKKQKFIARVALKHVYRKLSKPALKAQKSYQKYLGDMVVKSVKKNLIEFKAPIYYESNNYVRVGTTIVLYADEEYKKRFPTNPGEIWLNHGIERYLYLTEKLK